MSDGGTDWEDEEESPERPFGTKPFGTKPFGTKPFGTKPFGTKPFGTKPFGAKPFGTKPFGTKPFGTKPFGTKPFGTKGDDGGSLDPEEWSADIAQLVCERSALIRLGATLVASEPGGSLPTPAFEITAGFRAPGEPEPELPESGEAAELRPGEWRLSAAVALSPRVLGALGASPELAYTLKTSLAEELARSADEAFLQGPGEGELQGIAARLEAASSDDEPLGHAGRAIRRRPLGHRT